MSFAPVHRLIIALLPGPRTQEMADILIEETDRLIARPLPLFVSDGLKMYIQALLRRYHYTREFARTGKPGRPRKPLQLPLQELKYAQVMKKRRNGRVVRVEKRIIFGSPDDIPRSEISTSHIERQNLTLRQENHRLERKTLGYSKDDAWLGYQCTFYRTHCNFVRTNDALKIPVEPPRGTNLRRKYQKRTPLMSLGITDHVWSLDELLRYPYHKTSTN